MTKTNLLSFFWDTVYMLLTVVANGHTYVATATANNAQGRSQDFTLVATEAERRRIFSQKI